MSLLCELTSSDTPTITARRMRTSKMSIQKVYFIIRRVRGGKVRYPYWSISRAIFKPKCISLREADVWLGGTERPRGWYWVWITSPDLNIWATINERLLTQHNSNTGPFENGVGLRASIASLMLKRLFLRHAITKRPHISTPPNSNQYSTHNTQEQDDYEPFDTDLAAEQDIQNLRKQKKTEWKRRQRVRFVCFLSCNLVYGLRTGPIISW